MTQYRALIKWEDDGAEMEVIFDDDVDEAENDDYVFFYGWKPEVMSEDEYGYDGWIVLEVYDEV